MTTAAVFASGIRERRERDEDATFLARRVGELVSRLGWSHPVTAKALAEYLAVQP